MLHLDSEGKKELRRRALDAAITAMTRNRVLLFTINMVAASLLVTVYLERESLDDKQRQAHLVVLQDILVNMRGLGLPQSAISSRDPIAIEQWIWENQIDETSGQLRGAPPNQRGISNSNQWLQLVSTEVHRLRRLRNEMLQVHLPASQTLPIGLSVPRNDLAPIAGLLLLILYSWFCFSVRQLVEIVRQIKQTLIPDAIQDTGSGAPATLGAANILRVEGQRLVREIIELHYLFRTSRPGPAKWFVNALYYSPPLAMTVATINDVYSVSAAGGSWSAFLSGATSTRTILEVGLVVALSFIGYQIGTADKDVNVASYGRSTLTNELDVTGEPSSA